MQDLSGLFLTKSIALAACGAIVKNPDSALTSGALVKILHGNVSKGNASKNISALKKLGILDESDVPTELGKKWADKKTRKEATSSIVQRTFPFGINEVATTKISNKEFAAWIADKEKITSSVAEKCVTAYKNLIRIANESQSQKTKQKAIQDKSFECETSSGKRRLLCVSEGISQQQFHMVASETSLEDATILMLSQKQYEQLLNSIFRC